MNLTDKEKILVWEMIQAKEKEIFCEKIKMPFSFTDEEIAEMLNELHQLKDKLIGKLNK